MVSDRDTLILMPPPPDDDYLAIARLARTNSSSDHPLLAQPVRVTRGGFEPTDLRTPTA